jgi:hypothetical protein
MTTCCPHCHRPLWDIRFGQIMTPLKGQIVDSIKAAGNVGITSEQLIAALYRDRRPIKPTCIKSHVDQINDRLASTDYQITSDRRRWFLSNSRKGVAAGRSGITSEGAIAPTNQQ